MYRTRFDSILIFVEVDLYRPISIFPNERFDSLTAVHRQLMYTKERFLFVLFEWVHWGRFGNQINNQLFGIGNSIVSNYFAHCDLTVINSLRHCNDAHIKWTYHKGRFV